MPCELRIWSITVTSKHTNQSHVTYIQTFQDRCPPTYEGWCVHESLYEILMKSMSQIGNSPFRFHRPQRSITAQHSTYPVPYVHMKMRRFTDLTPTVISRQDIFVLWALTQQTRYFHISPNHITSHQINATQKRAIWNWTTNWSKTQNGFVKIKLKNYEYCYWYQRNQNQIRHKTHQSQTDCPSDHLAPSSSLVHFALVIIIIIVIITSKAT